MRKKGFLSGCIFFAFLFMICIWCIWFFIDYTKKNPVVYPEKCSIVNNPCTFAGSWQGYYRGGWGRQYILRIIFHADPSKKDMAYFEHDDTIETAEVIAFGSYTEHFLDGDGQNNISIEIYNDKHKAVFELRGGFYNRDLIDGRIFVIRGIKIPPYYDLSKSAEENIESTIFDRSMHGHEFKLERIKD